MPCEHQLSLLQGFPSIPCWDSVDGEVSLPSLHPRDLCYIQDLEEPKQTCGERKGKSNRAFSAAKDKNLSSRKRKKKSQLQ